MQFDHVCLCWVTHYTWPSSLGHHPHPPYGRAGTVGIMANVNKHDQTPNFIYLFLTFLFKNPDHIPFELSFISPYLVFWRSKNVVNTFIQIIELILFQQKMRTQQMQKRMEFKRRRRRKKILTVAASVDWSSQAWSRISSTKWPRTTVEWYIPSLQETDVYSFPSFWTN